MLMNAPIPSEGFESEHTVMLPAIGHTEGGSDIGAASLAGELVVHYVTLADEHSGTPEAEGYRDQARRYEMDVFDHVENLRDSFSRLTSKQAEQLDGYLGGIAKRLSTGRHTRPLGKRPESTWAEWLAYGASDKMVYDFMATHCTVLEEKVLDRPTAEALERERQNYIEGIETMVAGDRMSKDALKAIPTLQRTRVLFGDIWDTFAKGYGGYHFEGQDNEVVLAQPIEAGDFVDLPETLELVLPHELGHVKFGHFMPSWIKEASNQLITLSMKYGEYERIAPRSSQFPDGRTDGNYTYGGVRELLEVLMRKGNKRLSTALVTKAYTSEGLESSECQELMRSVDDAWGEDGVIQKVTAQIEARIDALLVCNPKMLRIHAQGAVVNEVSAEWHAKADALNSAAE